MLGWQIIALIAGGAGLLLGVLVTRRSHQENPLVSAPGQVLNYLASVAVVSVPLSALTGLVRGEFRTGVTVALGALAATIVLDVLHAIPESLARSRTGRSPGVLKLAWERWISNSQPIGEFNSWLVLGLFYVTIMLPFGLLSRLFSDRLRLKKQPEGTTLWLARERVADLTVEEARRQF